MKLNPLQMNPALLSNAAAPTATAMAGKSLNMEKIEETAKDFEAMFLSEMLKPVFDTVEVNETFGGGKTEEIFGGFLRDEYSKMLAGTGTMGIAELVKEELIEMQSRANNPALAQNVHSKNTKTTGEDHV